MPFYRGVEQSELLKSINDGLALLEKYSIGEECQKRIDEIRVPTSGVSSLAAIAQAKNDEELILAVKQCGASYIFARLDDVMKYHALNNTDGAGLQIFDNLSQWGVFGGAMTLEYNRLDEEQQCWLLCRYARKIADGQASAPLRDKFTLSVTALANKEVAAGKRLLKEAVRLAKKDGTDQAVVDYFDTLELSERHALLNIAQVMSGMTPEKLQDKNPIGRYGVVIDDLRTGKVNWTDPSVTAIRENVDKALSPFWGLDEVQMTGVGLILTSNFDKNAPQGIMFGSSRRAAEAVAAAMPGYQVIDAKGKTILPPPSLPKVQAPKPPGA